MKSILSTLGLFIAIVFLASSFKTDQEKYKNLKILPKDISSADLDSIMNSYNVALGVKCGFCHVENKQDLTWDYASDAKGHKKVARNMMTMTDDINKKYFEEDNEGRKIPMVTCYTCHNGRKEPYFRPVVENATPPFFKPTGK